MEEEIKIRVKWLPKSLNLEVDELSKISCLYEAETLEDYTLENFHPKGSRMSFSHKIETHKHGELMIIAPNPIEFYIYGARKSLLNINNFCITNKNGLNEINGLLFEIINFLIFLYSGLESLVNQKIPKDIRYDKDGRVIQKEEIERWMSLEDKIKKVLSINVGNLSYWSSVLQFIEMRHRVVHLKSAICRSDFLSYQELYKDLLDFDHKQSFEDIKAIMKVVAEHV